MSKSASLLFLSLAFVFSASFVRAEDSGRGGWLRDKIKERIKKKLEEKPAPEASKDVTQKIDKPGDYTYTVTVGGMNRYYKVHVPQKYTSTKSAPLLFVLHGGGGDMEIQSNEEYYHQISKSESEGHIAIFPNGSSQFQSGKLGTWNAGKCCGKGRDKNVDDVGFIKEILKNVSQQLNIDKNRIYATGMSNGGMVSYRLACEMPDTFKAIASVAGTDNTISCSPTKPISILHIHAKDDDHVLFNGGAGEQAFKDKSMVTDFASVPNTVAKWVKFNHCDPTPKKVLEKAGAYCEEYTKCSNNVRVKLCVTETGGHSWPGGKKPAETRSKTTPSTAISANDVMWDFFNGK